MITSDEITEEQAVAIRSQANQARFVSKRTASLIAAIGTATACVLLMFLELWYVAICLLFVFLISVSNYFAANGHLHYIQKRDSHRKRLVRGFAKLKLEPTDTNNDRTSTAKVTAN